MFKFQILKLLELDSIKCYKTRDISPFFKICLMPKPGRKNWILTFNKVFKHKTANRLRGITDISVSIEYPDEVSIHLIGKA